MFPSSEFLAKESNSYFWRFVDSVAQLDHLADDGKAYSENRWLLNSFLDENVASSPKPTQLISCPLTITLYDLIKLYYFNDIITDIWVLVYR